MAISYIWLFQWDYTFYKWGFLRTYKWYNSGHNCKPVDFSAVFHRQTFSQKFDAQVRQGRLWLEALFAQGAGSLLF